MAQYLELLTFENIVDHSGKWMSSTLIVDLLLVATRQKLK